MRKNKLMRAAAGLMVATLLTTSIISGTLAKYTTTGNGQDTARVAKFGVAITANGGTFATSYDDTVKSGTTEKVIAPGTKGEMAKMALTGTPEVSVRVNYTGDFKLNDNWIVDTNTFYCPLKITVKSADGTTEINGADHRSKKDFEDAVNNAIKAYSKEYAPGTNLAEQSDDSLTVSWEWAYDADDTKDTKLGNATDAGTVTLAVTTTVTQID